MGGFFILWHLPLLHQDRSPEGPAMVKYLILG
jgi:hypothetical protein